MRNGGGGASGGAFMASGVSDNSCGSEPARDSVGSTTANPEAFRTVGGYLQQGPEKKRLLPIYPERLIGLHDT